MVAYVTAQYRHVIVCGGLYVPYSASFRGTNFADWPSRILVSHAQSDAAAAANNYDVHTRTIDRS